MTGIINGFLMCFAFDFYQDVLNFDLYFDLKSDLRLKMYHISVMYKCIISFLKLNFKKKHVNLPRLVPRKIHIRSDLHLVPASTTRARGGAVLTVGDHVL